SSPAGAVQDHEGLASAAAHQSDIATPDSHYRSRLIRHSGSLIPQELLPPRYRTWSSGGERGEYLICRSPPFWTSRQLNSFILYYLGVLGYSNLTVSIWRFWIGESGMPGAATQQDKGNGGPDPKHNIEAAREEFYQRISKRDMAPLWKVMSSVVTKEPVTRCVPHVWHYDDVKSLVMESGGLITAEEALRRVLILENPALRGESRATNTLFAGIQMILPGEVAPAHRHVSSAIRFVLDGEGAYTAVEGEKAFMSPGDFVITANWAPHDHGNPSQKPMLWLDVLDFPAVNFYEASFADYFDENDKMQNTTRGDGDSLAFFGSG